MKYLCLVYLDENKLHALTKLELDALVAESLDYDEVLRQSGHYMASDALQSVETATTIRIRDGKVFTTDGPFAETKEQLGGFILIEARDLDDAIRVAARIPAGPARLHRGAPDPAVDRPLAPKGPRRSPSSTRRIGWRGQRPSSSSPLER